MLDLGFSQQCCWGFMSSGMWHYAAGWAVLDISKKRSTLIFKNQVLHGLLAAEHVGTKILLNVRKHNVTSQKTFIHKLQCYRIRTILSMKGQQGHHKDFTHLAKQRTDPEELTNGNISILVATKQFCTCTLHITTMTCMISGFCCSENEVFAVLRW